MDLDKLEVHPRNQEKVVEEESASAMKTYTFRSIPPDLHRAWKTVASLKSISMEDFALIAIDAYIKQLAKESNSG